MTDTWCFFLQLSGLDINVLQNDGDGFPGEEDGQRASHGTSCAGIIAMEKNNECGVGVAYQASITGTCMCVIMTMPE